jgi:two-component system response regulator LytT
MSSKIKAIIIEDELPALKELQYILEQTGIVEVIDTAVDGVKGFEKICSASPDVVFVDVQIPGISGVELVKKIRESGNDQMVVFTTAYDEHAIKAFELDAADYILKPYSEERIKKTVERLHERLGAKDNVIEKVNYIINSVLKNGHEYPKYNKIPCDQYGRVILVNEDDIIFCLIDNEQTFIKTANKKYLTNYTLHELEERFSFFRVHRSYLVNLNKIKELYPWFHGTYKIVMLDDSKTEIPVSRNNVKKLKDILGI